MAQPLLTPLFQLYLIIQWILLSSTIILFNKWILSTKKFHFPLTIVIMHMVFVGVCAQVYRRLGLSETPNISWRDYIVRFLPIAAFFAASLGFGNAAYLYISVAFVQMLKASTPICVLLCSFGFGLETPSIRLFVYIVIIAAGVATACYGQIEVSWIGVILQMAAVVVEAFRLCLVNIALTSRGIKLSSITFLSVVAPLCALVLLPLWAYFEAPAVLHNNFAPIRHVGFPTLFANASVAFLLNIATMALIKHTSALTLNVSGVFKDVGLVLWSVLVSGAVVTHLQYVGYGIAIWGVSAYSAFKRGQQTASKPPPLQPVNDEDEDEEGEPLAAAQGDEKSFDSGPATPEKNGKH